VTSPTAQRFRFAVVAILFGIVAFYAGTHFISRTPVAAVHPLTGRQIAGIATDAAWMERASREQEEQPDLALSLIGIEQGTTVADIGAGSGYMTTRLARLVGGAGTVYANDIQANLLRIIQQKANSDHLSNVQIVQGTQTETNLPEHAVDLALLVDVYHEFWYPQAMLRSLRHSLKPDGRLVLIEYRKEDPSIPIADTHRMSVADMRTEVRAEGFRFEQVIERLPRQHIIIFRNPSAS
jgi:ubiquinone/menaquinone biosynthesis C-methylase UbiE